MDGRDRSKLWKKTWEVGARVRGRRIDGRVGHGRRWGLRLWSGSDRWVYDCTTGILRLKITFPAECWRREFWIENLLGYRLKWWMEGISTHANRPNEFGLPIILGVLLSQFRYWSLMIWGKIIAFVFGQLTALASEELFGSWIQVYGLICTSFEGDISLSEIYYVSYVWDLSRWYTRGWSECLNIRRKKLICKGCYFRDGSSQIRQNVKVKLQHFLLLQLPQHHLQSLTVLSQVRALIIILQQTPMLLNCLSMEFDRFKGEVGWA